MDGWSRSALAVEWISRLRSSKSASTTPNIVFAKLSIVVTKPNIVIIGRCVSGRAEKEGHIP